MTLEADDEQDSINERHEEMLSKNGSSKKKKLLIAGTKIDSNGIITLNSFKIDTKKGFYDG